jgi:Avidin family
MISFILTDIMEMELSGTWVNQLGSKVTLDALEDGTLQGFYHTAVSSANKPLPGTPITGRWQSNPAGVLFGFTAMWMFEKDGEVKYSSTSWSGRSSEGKLVTTWLLTSANSPDWESVRVNKDVFVKQT